MEYESSCSIFFVLCGDWTLLQPQRAGLSPNPSAREGNSYNRKKGT